MHLSLILSLSLLSGAVIGGVIHKNPPQYDDEKCTNPRVRRSWHYMEDEEKFEYIRAVKCIYEQPSQGSSYFPAAINRHDDFASLHINQTTAPANDPANKNVKGAGIHFNGVFLPWHRYLVWAWEEALINECNYTGAQPYWDWSLDNPELGGSMETSPIFDADTGFGGNGINGSVPDNGPRNSSAPSAGSCIGDGPFAQGLNNLGYGYNLDKPQPHCIVRNWNQSLFYASGGWSNAVKPLLKETSFVNFTFKFDTPGTGAPAGIHGAGHSGTGGEMRNVYSSINDPLFFMHHAQLDHVWWSWQNLKEENKFAVGGPVYPNGTGTVTEDYPVALAPFVAPDVTIKDVLDTQNEKTGGVLCYVYEDIGRENPYDDDEEDR